MFRVFVENKFKELGPTFSVLKSFAEMGKLDDGQDYVDLYRVPQLSDEDIADPELIQEQATLFKKTYGSQLTTETKELLTILETL